MNINFLTVQDRQEQWLSRYGLYLWIGTGIFIIITVCLVIAVIVRWLQYNDHVEDYVVWQSQPAVIAAERERLTVERDKRRLLQSRSTYYEDRNMLWRLLDMTTTMNSPTAAIQLNSLHLEENQWRITGMSKDGDSYERWKSKLQSLFPAMEVQGQQQATSSSGMVAFSVVCHRRSSAM